MYIITTFPLIIFSLISLAQVAECLPFENGENSPIASDSCVLPKHPANGQWTILGAVQSFQPKTEVESNTVINFKCNSPYKLVGQKIILCENGNWSDNVPQCANNITSISKFCPALASTDTTKVTCTHEGNPVNCSAPLSGTVAKFKCAPFYENLHLKVTANRICLDGSWDLETPNCVPACGRKSVRATSLIMQGNNVINSEYPWQVAIYSVASTTKLFICGGTLISHRSILTAAHCVTDIQGNIRPKESFVVSVGKYHSKFDDPRDTDAQSSTLKEIHVADQYRGEIQNFNGDIAILITENTFKPSKFVAPVCVDWGQNFENDLTRPDSNGIITGWGLTEANGNVSDVLKEVEVPLIEDSQCHRELPPDFAMYLTHDKFCAGYLNKSIGICNGDAGGGLIVRNRYDNRFYITGIASVSSQIDGGCDVNQYALYTKVSSYYSFLFEKQSQYRPRIN